MTKREMMKKAHLLAKTVSHLGGHYSANFAIALTVVWAEQKGRKDPKTIEEACREQTSSEVRFKPWRGANETRIYVSFYTNSRNARWIDCGMYRIDPKTRTFAGTCKLDVQGFEKELAAALAA